MKRAVDQQKHLEDRIQNSSREILSIVGCPIGQLQLPQTTMMTLTQTTSQEPPPVPPGVTPTTSCCRAPGTINGEIEEQNKSKKQCTDEDQMIQGMEDTSAANIVCQIISHNLSTLIMTDNDDAGSTKKDNVTLT